MNPKNLLFAICISFLTANCLLPTLSFSEGIRTQKANFIRTDRNEVVGFSTGIYKYAGTEYVGSFKNDFWKLPPPCSITLTITTTNSACGQATGTATVVATGGTGPYTYQWTNGDVTANADTLSAGLYMVTVTDSLGCTAQSPAMISDAGAPAINVTSVTNVSCTGGNNGAINITVTGGAPPYTYLWNIGATIEDCSTLYAGPYEIEVTDASGCKSTISINVSEPTPISHSISTTNASCGNPDGTATDSVSGGTPPYSYLWNPSAATAATATGLSAGGYMVTVTDNNGCTSASQATIVNFGAPAVTIDSIIPAGCASGTGSIYITLTGGSPPFSYVWSNGSTTQDLTGVAPSMYGLTIYGSNPCTGGFSAVIPSQIPAAPVICIVTVDTATGKNLCAFEKDSIANLSLAQYNFYRETTVAGIYQQLGSKAANLLSAWTDQSANPLQRAWRYKITAVDTCGNESTVSNFHKTIHLAASLGLGNTVNLIWDDYEGFTYGTYIIYRYDNISGWDSLDAVPSNLHSYTDLTPPLPLLNVFYYIEVVPPSVCSATIKNPIPMATNFNSSKSNIYKINPTPTSANEVAVAYAVAVYPNPSSGKFTVISSGAKQSQIEAYNVFGEKVYSEKILSPKPVVNGAELSLILNLDVPSGIYFLKIKTDERTIMEKIIIRK